MTIPLPIVADMGKPNDATPGAPAPDGAHDGGLGVDDHGDRIVVLGSGFAGGGVEATWLVCRGGVTAAR